MRRLRDAAWVGTCIVLAVSAHLTLTGSSQAPARPSSRPIVRFLMGSPGGFNQRGFLEEYAKALPSIDLVPVNAARRGPTRLEELQRGEADLAINTSHAAYLAYSGQLEESTERFDRLRAISTLGVVPVHLVARTGSEIRSVADLRDHAVGVGVAMGEMYRLSKSILAAFGVAFSSIRVDTSPSNEAAERLRAGNLDAMFVVGGYPAESVRAATAGNAAYLVPIEGPAAERLRLDSRFLQLALVPARTYPGQDHSIRTMGVQNILVCRRELDEQVTYELTKQFFAALPRLATLVSSLRLINVNQASATLIPLHDGAGRYYRERELFR
jgi:TRAP transporter TAXI family solute receptor